MKTRRIIRLYRPVVGWRWWVQLGEWMDSSGAVKIATGRGRRTFRVDREEPFGSREEAEARHGQEAQGIHSV